MKIRNFINHFSERMVTSNGGRTNSKAVRMVSYVVVFVVVVSVVAVSYNSSTDAHVNVATTTTTNTQSVSRQVDNIDSESSSQQAAGVASEVSSLAQSNNANTESAGSGVATSSVMTVNEVKAANLASSVAATANLSSSNSVSSNAESANVSADLAQADVTSASKQQVTEPTVATATKPIVSYVAQNGDNAQTIAQKFNVSDQTIRWANNLTDDNVAPGAQMTIPTIDGVVYVMKDGDKLSDVANKYKVSVNSIVEMNNLDDENVASGTQLILPDGVLPENERPGYVEPVIPTTSNRLTSSSSSTSTRSSLRVPTAGSNTYAYGYCTWYAFNRRVQLGLPVANRWGNANTWDTSARAAGYLVNTTPSVGAIFQTDSGYYGHVGIVERINPDGSIYVSEMNYTGWNVLSNRTITNLSGYKFIH